MRPLLISSFSLAFLSTLAAQTPLQQQPAQHPSSLRVLDSATHAAARDAVVTVDGGVVVASADGSFTLPAKAKTVGVRAPGYKLLNTTPAQITNNQVVLMPFDVHALYLSEYGIASKPIRDAALDIIRKGGANALVINIKSDHGQLVYPSKIPLAEKIGARKVTTISSLTDLVNNGHGQGIYMIARIVTFKDEPLATSRPDLAIHLADGSLFHDKEGLHWADPTQPEVRAYDIAIGVEAAKAGFDEVEYDYVRFPDSAAKLRVHGATDEASRIATISGFLEDAHKALAPYNVFHAADIFGYTFWNTNDTGIGQQLDHLVDKVDYLCPMLYPSGFAHGIPGYPKPMDTTDDIHATIKQTIDRGISRTNINPKKLRPWLQAFRDYAFDKLVFGPEQVQAQTRVSREDNLDGWLLWNPRNDYSGAGLTGAPPKPPAKPATKPAPASETKPAAKPDAAPEAKPAVKPTAKAEITPQASQTTKP